MIKIIALLSMILDHIGFVFTAPAIGHSASPIMHLLRHIGRIAFPLYAFLIGEGCRHTKNINKYLARLLIFAIISEIPFDFLRARALGRYIGSFADIFDFSAQNIFFTLFLGALSIAIYLHLDREKGKTFALIAGFFVTMLCAYAAELINSDFGSAGVILIAAPFMLSDCCPQGSAQKLTRVLVMAICLLHLYGIDSRFLPAALISMVFILLYNGNKGRPVRWGFYLAYPIHMIVLVIAYDLFRMIF